MRRLCAFRAQSRCCRGLYKQCDVPARVAQGSRVGHTPVTDSERGQETPEAKAKNQRRPKRPRATVHCFVEGRLRPQDSPGETPKTTKCIVNCVLQGVCNQRKTERHRRRTVCCFLQAFGAPGSAAGEGRPRPSGDEARQAWRRQKSVRDWNPGWAR